MARSDETKRQRLVGGWWLALAAAILATEARAQEPIDRFLESLAADTSLEPAAVHLIRQSWEKCQDCDPSEFLTQGLAVLSPAFREGLDAYDADQYERCVEVMSKLRGDANPFVAVHAAAYEIKALVAMDRLLDAGERIKPLIGRPAGNQTPIAEYSYLAPEIRFLHGYCLLADLQYDAAQTALSRFLHDYPDASQRLVLAAQQMLAELATRQPGRIDEVVDLMAYAKRRLKHRCVDETVRTRQQRVIEILDRLIEDAENQENSSSSSSSSSGGNSNGNRPSPQNPSNPMQESRLPQGGAAEGPLREARRANPAETWGSMPPAERERILQALRDSFPSRYRRLVEQYYEQLGKE